MGALLLALVAAMTPFVAGPDRAYAQAALSADATLSGLTVAAAPAPAELTGEALTPTFAAATTKYDLRIGFTDSGVVVTPIAATGLPADQSQTIRVDGTVVASGTARNVPVAAGMTKAIRIEVTAPAGNKNTYTVNVYRNRQNLSMNANLSSLGLTGVSLSPAFSSGTTTYEARVKAEEVTVTYGLSDTAGGASAALTVANGGTDSDTDDMVVPLGAAGSATKTAITVTVTPEAGAGDANANQKAYVINVYRIRDNESTEARLASSTGLGLTASDADGTDVTIDGYTYGQDTMMYDLTVPNNVAYVTLAPSVADPGAQFVISPSTDSRPAVDDHQVNLRAGVDTTVKVTVTAEDPSSMETYTLTIYKRRPATAINPALDDATLSALSLSPAGTLMPAFRSGTMAYDAQVASGVEKVTVSYTPTNNLGGVTVVGSVATHASDTSTITPAYNADKKEVTLDGEGVRTVITLTVTPENGDASDNDVIRSPFIA